MNKNKKTESADQFFKSKDGQDSYDKELTKLRENRNRLFQWKKEQDRQVVQRMKKRDTSM